MAFCNDCTSGSFIDWFSGYTLDDCANYGFYPGYDLNDWLNNEWNYDFSSWDYKQPASDVSSSLSTCAFSSAASSPSPNSDFSSTSLSLEEFKSVFSSSVNNFNCGFNTLKSNESGNGKKVAFSLPSTPAPVQERLAPLNFSQTGSVAAPTKTASTKEATKSTKEIQPAKSVKETVKPVEPTKSSLEEDKLKNLKLIKEILEANRPRRLKCDDTLSLEDVIDFYEWLREKKRRDNLAKLF